MNDRSSKLSSDQIQRRRMAIRRGLSRAGWAVLAIVGVVLGLAVAGVLAAYRASGNARQAQAAKHQAEEELCRSYLAQASSGRLNGQMGRRKAGLRILEMAAKIHPSLDLRNEVIAHLALTDVEATGAPAKLGSDFARDASWCSFRTRDGTLHVRDPRTDLELRSCCDTNGYVHLLRLSPNGQYCAAVRQNAELFIWDLASCKQIALAPFSGDAASVQFTPDNSRMVYIADERTLRFVDPSSGREIAPALKLPESANGFVFHPREDKIAVRTDTAVQIWDLATRQMLQSLEHNASITAIDWTGPYLAVGDERGEIQVWNLQTRRTQRWAAHKMLVSTLLFDHGGDMLVSGSYDMSSGIWDPQTRHLIALTWDGSGVAFSPEDTEILGHRKSSTESTWSRWRVIRPPELRIIRCYDTPADPNICWADFSRDRQFLAVVKSDGLRLFEMSSGKSFLFIPMERARRAFFLPDGKTLMTFGDYRISLWPILAATNTAPLVLGVPRHIPLPKTQHVDAGTLDASGRKFALQLTDTEVAVVDLENCGVKVFQQSIYGTSPVISPDAKWVVTGTFHGPGSFLWDAESGTRVRQLGVGNANPCFSPDGKTLVLSGDAEYAFFDTATWKPVRHISTGNQGDLPGGAGYSHDGRILCLVKGRQEVQLLDALTYQPLATLTPPEPQIMGFFAFSPDDELLAVGTGNDQVHCWDLRKLRGSLAAFGLDWNTSKEAQPLQAVTAGVDAGAAYSLFSPRFLILTFAAVILVVYCAASVLQRQRQLFNEYVEIDNLNERQHRELAAAQAVIVHSQKMRALGTLAAGIAHDFNNLLSVIRMSNKLIGRQAPNSPEIQEHVAEVEKAVQQGKNVVRSMLGYSREQPEGSEQISLPDLVEDVVGLLTKQFLSGITLNLELDRATPAVRGARPRLEQVLLNLIVNASEAMDGKGNLRISVKPDTTAAAGLVRKPASASAYVLLAVSDTGPGIDPHILPRIFEPFFTTKLLGANRGTGLGLSTVDTIAEQDGLGIGVETKAGEGTTFRIILPIDPDVPH